MPADLLSTIVWFLVPAVGVWWALCLVHAIRRGSVGWVVGLLVLWPSCLAYPWVVRQAQHEDERRRASALRARHVRERAHRRLEERVGELEERVRASGERPT